MHVDQLVPLVDQIESRLDFLLNIAQTNCNAVETISSTYKNMREMELEIHHLGDAMMRTQAWLHNFSSLHEKSVFLEHLISQGDLLSSKALFDAISAEYQQLLDCQNHLAKNQGLPWENRHDRNAMIDSPQEEEFTRSEQQPRNITKMPSISHLQLKPIRCSSKQLYKKKSRYRLSGLFNVNPISLDDSPRLSIDYSESESSPCASPLADITNYDSGAPNMFPPKTPFSLAKRTVFAESSYDSPASNTEASFGGVRSINCFTEDTGVGELPPPNASYDMCLPFFTRNRSNSVPCTGQEAITNSLSINCESQEGDQIKDKHLRHFISYPRIPLANKNVLMQCDQESLLSAISFEVEKEPRDCDIDFAAYLRSAPEEVNEVLPLRRVKSQDSIFNEPKTVFKNRNPAEGLRPIVRKPSPTLDCVLPTTTPVNILQRGDSRSLLTNVMRQNTSILASDTSIKISPNPAMKHSSEDSPVESLGKSITSSFRNFLNTSPKKQKQPALKRAVRFEMPHTPIQAPNYIQEKRKPINIPRTDGAHSQLIIGPGLLRILKHGDSLVFKRPATLNLRADHLHDALEHAFI